MKEYIEIPQSNVFYEIPGYNNYVISKTGKVMNIKTNKILLGSLNPAGYLNIRLTDNYGKTMTWGLHRLLGFVFKEFDGNLNNLYINHIDGNKRHNDLNNLEWVTPKQNVEHAGLNGLTDKCIPVSMRDVDTGEILKFPSIVECARYMGVSKDTINYRVKSGEDRVFPERKQYRGSHNDDPWIIPKNIELAIMLNGTSKKVVVRNVLNGNIKEYDQLTSLSNDLKIPLPTINLWLKQKNQPVLPGFIQIKWLHDITPWRNVIDPYLELSMYAGTKPVKVINSKTDVIKIFSSTSECAKEMGISTTLLNYRLKSNGKITYPDGYKYSYYSNES